MTLAAPQAMVKAVLRDDLLRRMLKNTSYLLTGTAGSSFLALVALALTARSLGPELLGVLAMIQAYAGMVDRARIETWPALIKYGAEALEEERYDDFKGLIKFGFLIDVGSALFATIVAVAGVFAAGWWFDWAPETVQMAGLFSISILFRTSSMPTAVLRLFNRFGLDAVQDVVTNAVRVLLVAIAYMAGAGLWTFLLITMGAQILNSVVLTIVGWTVLRRQGYRGVMTSSCKGIRQRCPGIWSFIWSLNAGNIARRSTRELDILFVGGVLDPAAASLYHIAKKLGEILVLAGTPIQQAVYPELARLWARAEATRFRRTVTQIDLGSGGLGVAFLVVVAFNAELLITLTMGARFTAAAGPLVLQTLGVVVFLFGTALRPALFSMGMQVRFLQIVTVSTICFYVTLLTAVPSFGIYGAPLAHIVYNLVWLVAMRAAFVEGIRQGPAAQASTALPADPPPRSA
ncbi:MAG: lipopolysaccharide biosynthesis protein [Geminicoccaceae bacterium]